MPRKKSAYVDIDGKPRRVTFLNDADGLSAKDYLLLISTGVFFLALTVGFVSVLIGRPLGDEYFDLLDASSPVVMAVVVSVTGMQGVEAFANRKKASKDEEFESQDEI